MMAKCNAKTDDRTRLHPVADQTSEHLTTEKIISDKPCHKCGNCKCRNAQLPEGNPVAKAESEK